ncbi:hypothetical protein [Candidatus Uabimicrobium amorphum]|uniref:Uncharacterized protein n=1 Tax=Uabimicrobium amorphum TaxID=2596890 RepID=A0A5S9F3M7_UABAM|nr:hypothetical protein [Candidatus Uabimicrobium amorphum]BBM84421.1 hypothetical protein UABAM_02781 [Candidatus Uabimicrobium amorphum]
MRKGVIFLIVLVSIYTQETNFRSITLDITTEFPIGENIDPKVVELDGKDVRQNLFPSGIYELKIIEPGFLSICKSVTIPPGDSPFVIRETLRTKLRRIDIRIIYDVEPPNRLKTYKITMSPLAQRSIQREVRKGDTIKPGSYLLRISQPMYESIEVKQHVWPDNRTYVIDQKLFAKQVPINFQISHDVNPPDSLGPYSVWLMSKKLRVLFMGGEKIRPGKYDLKIFQPGYYTIKKVIDIKPSEDLFLVKEQLIAKKRTICFELLVINGGCLQDASKIINLDNQKEIGFRDTFKPGQRIHLLYKFRRYEDFEISTILPPGEGPYHFKRGIALVHLHPLEFTVRHSTKMMDGIKYEYTFTIDGKTLQDIHIKKEKGIGRFYYTLMIPKGKIFRAYVGYKYMEIELKKFRSGMSIKKPNRISVIKLIEHLKKVGEKDGDNASLNVVIKLYENSDDKEMLQQLSRSDIKELVTRLKSLKLNKPKEQNQLQKLIDHLTQDK